MQSALLPPFTVNAQLNKNLDSVRLGLPGHPDISLNSAQATLGFVSEDLCPTDLNTVGEHLWLVSTHSNSNITPLHQQLFRGRLVTLMEDPALHLTWSQGRIFIKPMPKYLLSHPFWDLYLLRQPVEATPQSPAATLQSPDRDYVIRSALGFLRTYAHLIRYESDFRIAQQDTLQLIPKEVTWEEFCTFRAHIQKIEDSQVSKRYEYGELRLDRLNLLAMLFLRRMAYQDTGLQYADYFAPYFAPLLFVFGVFSVVLSAMQVGLATESIRPPRWFAFEDASRWFAVISIIASMIPVLLLLFLLVVKMMDEIIFAVKSQYKKRSSYNVDPERTLKT